MLRKEIVVLGAGMVGVCSALALQKKGLNVTLIDSGEVGAETSFGNAGMITPSSIIPFNNPNIFKALPTFLTNKSAGFRYDFNYAFSELSSLLRFLSFARTSSTNQRIGYLYQLIERSMELHQRQAGLCNMPLRNSGWLRLYRTVSTFKKSAYEQDIFKQFNVQTQRLNPEQIKQMEPSLKDIYHAGIHICDALSVASPGALVKAYAQQFINAGGNVLQFKVQQLQQMGLGWRLKNDAQESIDCKALVIATGPWSKELLKKVNLNLPMIFERGGHREFQNSTTQALSTPIHDVDGSFVATPSSEGIRISCGVELNQQSAIHANTQLDIVEKNARQALDIACEHSTQWHGARPTMPDSLPVIGETKLNGLWLNTGHQHIGFSTGPGSAEILTSLITGENCALPMNAFSPSRFNL